MKNYKLVIFDLDGTIVNTCEGIFNGIKYVQKKMQLKEITYEQMRSHIGPPMEESFSRNFNLSGVELSNAVCINKEYAIKKGLYEASVYKYIPELLETLKNQNKKICVATLKNQETANKMMEYFNLSKFFDCIAGTTLDKKLSKADLLNQCIKKIKVKNEDAVLIGDSSYDAKGAEESNIDFIGVSYGFGFKSISEINDYKNIASVSSVEDLISVFNK